MKFEVIAFEKQPYWPSNCVCGSATGSDFGCYCWDCHPMNES
jgi:hypothetical protein